MVYVQCRLYILLICVKDNIYGGWWWDCYPPRYEKRSRQFWQVRRQQNNIKHKWRVNECLFIYIAYIQVIWWHYRTESPLRNTGRRPISYYCPLCFPCFMGNIKCQCFENFLNSLNSFTITHIFKWIKIFVAVKIM